MTKITNDLYIENIAKNTPKQSNIMGKDDFLRLLIAQLQNQDPMNPMEDREFIAQMANFSTLEQMTNLNKSMESFIENQNVQNILSMQQFIGKEVTWIDSTNDQDVVTKNNKVNSVSINNGAPSLMLDSGETIALQQIQSINNNTMTGDVNSIVSASHLIGKMINFKWAGEEFKNVEVLSVLSKQGQTYVTVSDVKLNGEKIPVNSITEVSNIK